MTSPAGAPLSEATDFLAGYPLVEAIGVLMIDCHGSGRGKIIRRHELESLFTAGRGMPASMFAQDVAGDDVEGTGLLSDGGGRSTPTRCRWMNWTRNRPSLTPSMPGPAVWICRWRR